MKLKRTGSRWNRDQRININDNWDVIEQWLNQLGERAQDLVAEGQLTEEQYTELITVINGLIKSGYVDKSDLTPEFKGEIEGLNTQLASKVDEITFDINTKTLRFYSNRVIVDEVDVTEAGNADAVQSYIDTLISDGQIEGVTLADGSVNDKKTDFLNSINLYDGNPEHLYLYGNGNTVPYKIRDNRTTARTSKIKIEPNTTYTVIREPSERFKIATDSIPNRTEGELQGSVNILHSGDDDVYHATFTTGKNDVVLYVNYNETLEDTDVRIQVVVGEASGFVPDYYLPNEKLFVYNKNEVDGKIQELTGTGITPADGSVNAKKTDFLRTSALYHDEHLETYLYGNGGSIPFEFRTRDGSRTAKIKIKPNTTYTVIREPSERFKIATDSILDRTQGVLDGLNILYLGTDDVYHATFTTGDDDVVLYVNYTENGTTPDVRIQVVEGEATGFVPDYYLPNEKLHVYNKNEVDAKIQGLTGTPKKATLKFLMIGNSYSVDATTYLFDICQSVGIDVVIGVAYDSGQDLEGHWDKIQNSGTITAYNKWTSNNGHVSQPNALVEDIVADEDWDIVTFQQVSADSDDYSTFQPFLSNLRDYVKNVHPSTQLGLHMTWSRPNHPDMFNGIVTAYQQAMQEMEFDLLIPTGTAVENARTNQYLEAVGDRLTRDGTHLDEGVGRYIAALTVFNTVFSTYYQKDISVVDFYPTGVNPFLVYLGKIAVNNATINPFNVATI